MIIKIEELTKAIQVILDNPTVDYPAIVPLIQSALPQYDAETYLFLFMTSLADAQLEKQTSYSQLRDWILNKQSTYGWTAEQIALNIATTTAPRLMMARTEPVWIFQNGQEIFVSTNDHVEKAYKLKKELETYQALLNERYAELIAQNISDDCLQVTVKYKNEIEDYLGIKQKINEIQSQLEGLM